jgi:uncharacterized protein YcbX
MSNTKPTELGEVVSLWRYPVKSMMGEELNATEITERGLFGDRAYALVDNADGKAATAKNPREWPALFNCRATFVEPLQRATSLPAVRITLPDGKRVKSDQDDTGSCARCVMAPLAQGDLPKDPGMLRTAAKHNQVNVGVYAAVA